ncbi:prephenate dehydrogenase [Paraburkholderia domus]|uniref:prephenate dehydrogenase n=1 Tax=Paraburkholderia domus TaxID=2793075 RepID=UPI001EF0C7BB|nr:prephenate dehydrogenase [Paraburkholderia domus]
MSLSTISFWDGSKVCGTIKRNKTTGAYSGIPGDDMREARLKAKRNVRAAQIGAKPYAAARPLRARRGVASGDMC